MRNFALRFLRFYQRFFTLFSFGSCRYYPTCSEYAKWLFQYDGFFRAFTKSALRILRCNQFFAGGIDYPKIKKNRIKKPELLTGSFKKTDIAAWFIPIDNKNFFVVKSLRKDKN
ncbi:MAG: membrane protein insertion efficiency factor YidD [Campylobacteraceae bacterium]|jgi:putative membrane protein insertion efficiency factor|nr:membrane protein insertion efficiency factor YidD [Campylobacteraceae bacterium]